MIDCIGGNSMRLFDRKSLSHQLFLSILTITAFVLTVLFSVSLHLLQESYQREERASVLDKLSKCSRITDLSLEYMGQDSRMLSTNASLISAVVAPDHSRADRSISVLNLLEDVARTNDLVSKAVLYVGFDNSIYASDAFLVYSYKAFHGTQQSVPAGRDSLYSAGYTGEREKTAGHSDPAG